jgi:hypothetical protein
MTSTTIPTRVSATQIRGRRGLDLRRWASTALVAALAGAGLLGLPQPAGAEILPATTNLVVNGGFE